MSMEQAVPQKPKRKQKVPLGIRTLLGVLVLLTLLVFCVLSILSYGRVISTDIGGILGIVLLVLGVAFTFCQWIFPISSTEPQASSSTSSILPSSPFPTDTISQPVPQEQKEVQLWNIPYRRNPFFTGRENILTQLHDNLTGGKATTLTQPQTINGLGGVGKTQCAVEYAYRYQEDYRYILWANATSHETLTASFVALASLLQLEERNDQEQPKVVRAVIQWLETHEQWLLILDNADDLKMAFTFLPTISKGHILLTSRTQAVGGLTSSIEVREMDLQEGIHMLLQRTNVLASGVPLDQATQQAEAIVKEMGGLPLALDQAGAYIEESHCTLKDYLDAYQHRQTDLLKQRGAYADDHPDAVATTWSLSFETVERNNPLAAALLHACAFLAPDDIPEEILVEGANKLGPSFQTLANDPTLLQEAIRELLRYSLIRRSSIARTLFVHRLVQAVIQNTMSQEEQHQQAERLIDALAAVFPTVEPTTWAQCQRYLPHALACAERIEQWNIVSPQAARLLNTTGYYLDDRAQYADAEPLLQRALHICEQVLGPDHPDTAGSLNNLAALYDNQGRYEQAEPLLQRALHIYEQVLGPDHPDTAGSLNNLAALYDNQGRYEQAEPLFQRALHICEQVLGPDHPDTATIRANYTRFKERVKRKKLK